MSKPVKRFFIKSLSGAHKMAEQIESKPNPKNQPIEKKPVVKNSENSSS